MENNIISERLSKVDGFLISIERNYEDECYEVKAGLKKKWDFKPNNSIDCKVETDTEKGKVVIIFGKHIDVTIDDLIDFLSKIIEVNTRIEEMEHNFELEIEEEKKRLEEKYREFKKHQEEEKKRVFELNDESDTDVEEKEPKDNDNNKSNDHSKDNDENEK